jgi:hypothetical protein
MGALPIRKGSMGAGELKIVHLPIARFEGRFGARGSGQRAETEAKNQGAERHGVKRLSPWKARGAATTSLEVL